MEKYKEIATVEIKHEYYNRQNGADSKFVIKPNFETEQWMKPLGIIWRLTNDVLRIVLPESIDWPSIIAQESDRELTFELEVSDPLFFNFTDFPIGQLGQQIFKKGSESASEGAVISLVDSFKENSNPGKVAALIELSLSDLGGTSPIQYKVEFRSRKVTWKYNFVVQNQAENTNYELSGKSSELFSGPENVTLVNGQQAIQFTSDNNLFPFLEIYEMDLSLKSNGQTLIAHLPVANPQSLEKSKENDQIEIYSAIYVYI